MSHYFKKQYLMASVLAASVFAATGPLASEDIPVVPASVMKGAPAPITANSNRSAGGASKATGNSSPTRNNHLKLSPGVNEIVPIAVGHLNRIVTPFSEPQVTTTSAATTEIRSNVVYVGTDQEEPVTMFITQQDSEAEALSLTLLPKRIPPKELFVDIDSSGTAGFGLVDNRPAERWERSQPYTTTIRELLRDVALGDTPQGYTFSDPSQQSARLPTCEQSGLAFDFKNGQVMSGQSLHVFIGLAENTADRAIEFRESTCGNWDVAAVSAWPRNVLAPAEQTEVYVVRRDDREKQRKQKRGRPSLLTAGGN